MMSVLVDQITIGEQKILILDAAPTGGAGYLAKVGDLAVVSGAAGLYQMTGTNATDWILQSTVTPEDIQDAVASALSNSSNITFTYNDAGNTITADLTDTTVSAGSYGTASSVSQLTFDAKGRATSASNVSINITASQVSDFSSAADARITAQKGQPNGLCPLDSNSLIPSAYLPSYVDDVLEYANLAAFPVTGEANKIYVALDTNKTYRWSGSIYIEISPSEVTSVFGRTGAVSAQNGDYTASQVTNTPSGNISALTVQAAINELDSEKQPLDATLTALAAYNTNGIVVQTAADTFVGRAVAAGTGITVTNGNGVAGNPTVAITNTTVTAASYGAATKVGTFTVNAQGQLTTAADVNIAIPSTQVTDFVEAAQDAVLAVIQDSATIDFTYNDATDSATFDVIESGITHANISGLSNDDHLQYALLAGRSGGQTLNGSQTASQNLTLSSTANATKGKILLGTQSAYDEANMRLGVGTQAPDTLLQLQENNVKYNISAASTSTSGAVNAVIASITPALNSVELFKVSITGIDTSFNSVAYERTVRVKNVGGTVSINNIQADYTSEDFLLASANATFVVNASAVDVRVTGVGGTTITWKAVLQRIR